MRDFYRGSKVIVTGHTGFKGSWISYILYLFGAKVTGIGLKPNTNPNLFSLLNLEDKVDSRIIDIRNLGDVKKVFDEIQPEIVFHLAAQPLVLYSYENPVYTFDVNVMGTVNILECLRFSKSVKSFINITTDKVYENKEQDYGYKEDDRLNGYDPYSNSKSCSELVTSSYLKSFFKDSSIAISTCRAGNVIGGGDFNNNRIITDCVKYSLNHQTIKIRNPNSVRPYQHVLEPIVFYMLLAKKQVENRKCAGNYNIGPNVTDCVTTATIVSLFCDTWKEASWISEATNTPHESNFLKLDCSKATNILGWKPIWDVKYAIEKTSLWYQKFYDHSNIEELTKHQIDEYLKASGL